MKCIKIFLKKKENKKCEYACERYRNLSQFVDFKPLLGFDVKTSFAGPPVSVLIKPGDITNEFLIQKAIQFNGLFMD